jgi:Flp pilus assembly pilin Flp
MFNHIKRFWNDEAGPELVEWAVVTIILLVAAVILYVAVGKALGAVICSIYCWLQKVMESHDDLTSEDVCADTTKDSCET